MRTTRSAFLRFSELRQGHPEDMHGKPAGGHMATTGISIEEYNRTSYHPDLEYLDGELRERPVVQTVHSRLQVILGAWFFNHRREWKVWAGVEARTQVSATRVRLPDVVVVPRGASPQTLVDPPLIVIEILSPDDSYVETKRLAIDYQAMGVKNIWLFDPETRTAEMWTGCAWLPAARLSVAESPIYVDVAEIFAELDDDNG